MYYLVYLMWSPYLIQAAILGKKTEELLEAHCTRVTALDIFLVADTNYPLLCRSVGWSVHPSVRHIFELRAVFALLPLPSHLLPSCCVSGFVFFPSE